MVFVKHMKGPLKEPGLGRSRRPVWTNITVAATGQASVSGNALVPKTPEAFTYDADGNLTSDSLWTNVWNAENRLVLTESAAGVPTGARRREAWTYLPDGRWIERVVSTHNGSSYDPAGTNRFVWDGQVLLAVLDHTNGLVMSFLRGLDLSGSMDGAGGVGGVLAVTFRSNGTHFVCYDGNGNVMALTDAATGANSAMFEYGPFGEVIRATGPMARVNPFRFSTVYQDDETDLLMYVHRPYSASTGRFLSRDPFREVGFATVRYSTLKSRLLALSLTADMETWFTNRTIAFDWQSALQATGNPYCFLGNEPLSRWEVLGLFGDGDAKFKGHKDFSNLSDCPFDYTLEDQGSTSPWPVKGDPERHFRPLGRSVTDVTAAIKACGRDAFQRAMHRGQDYFSHYAKGYVWDPGNVFQKCAGYGHACDGTKPDEDPNAWSAADKWTQGMLKKWKDACCGCGK